MARPTKPKDLKPKAEGTPEVAAVPAAPTGAAPALDLKYIVMLIVIVLASLVGSAGSTYLTYTLLVQPEIAHMAKTVAASGGEEADGGEEHVEAPQVGMNLELDEFMVNLRQEAGSTGNQYLRAKMSLSVKVPDVENCYAQEHHAQAAGAPVVAAKLPEGGTIAGAAAPAADRTTLAEGHGEGGGPSCTDIFKGNMAKYVPTVRDVINAALMKRTAAQLATIEGQEGLKDEIKESLNAIMAPHYEVLRVNFEDFIIQR